MHQKHPTSTNARPLAVIAAVLLLVTSLFVPAASAQDDDVEISLIHGIPGLEVDIYADGDLLLDEFEFPDREDLSLLAGTTIDMLEVRRSGTNEVAVEAEDVDLPTEGNFSIVAHLNADAVPTLSVFSNNVDQIDAGQGRLTVRHAAAAGLIDVLLDGEAIQTDLENGKEVVGPLEPGTYMVEARDDDGDTVLDPQSVTIEEGVATVIYVVGSADDVLTTIDDSETITDVQTVEEADEEEADDDDDEDETSSNGDDSSGVTTMSEQIGGLSSAPGSVDTGLVAVTVTEVSVSRTLGLIAVVALLTGGLFAIRRRKALASS